MCLPQIRPKMGPTVVLLLLMYSMAGAQEVIVFSSNRPFAPTPPYLSSIFRMNADGTDIRELTSGFAAQYIPAPAVSPDGKWIAFVADGSLWRMRSDGSEMTFVTDNAETHTKAWSSDGTHIYFSVPGMCAEDIAVVKVDGSDRRIAVDAGVDFPEHVAAQVAVSSRDELAVIGGNCGSGPRHLYLMNRDRTDVRRLVENANAVNWAPDGERLVLNRCTYGWDCHIWTVNRDGTGLRQLTFESDSQPIDPTWSPDGSQILFSRMANDYSAVPLIVMMADGSNQRQLTFGDGVWDFDAVWVRGMDSTPPVVTSTITGTVGTGGWHTSDVTVTWSVSDPESAITSASGCGSVSVTEDTVGTTATCTATSAGGTTTESVTIKRDTTPPTVTCSVTPTVLWPANHKLWDVSATATASDVNAWTLRGLEILSSEADSGLGSDDLPGDIQGFPPGVTTSGRLRAERYSKAGRTYTLSFTVADEAGNAGTCAATVTAPHDQGNGKGKDK